MTMSCIQPTFRMTSQKPIGTYKNYKTTKRKREKEREKHFLYYDGLVLKQVV